MDTQLFTGFHHYALRVPDLARSIRFFKALGFRQVHQWALPAYRIDLAVMMQAPDGRSWIELFDLKATIALQGRAASRTQDTVTGALAHICLTVRDLDRASDQIIAAGARHLHGPEALDLSPDPGQAGVRVRNAIFEGPGGEVIELLEPVRFPGDRPD